MYNNFSSKKTKKVISALLASALVVTSGPITADAATAKVVGVKKSITVSASATNKVTGLSKAEKKVVKVTKKGKKFTIKGLKAGKATFKIGKKSYTVKVGATAVKAAKTKLTLTKGKKATLKFTTKSGNGDTLTFKASNKNVTLAKTSAKIAKSAASVKATAKKAGKTTITATSKATGKKATVTVTVKNAAKPATTTPGASNTPVATATGSATNTPEATATATATATASGSATNTPDVTATPVATATATPVATGSATNTPEATEVPTEAPTKAPEVVTGGTITVTTNVTGASIKVVSNGSVVAETTNTATSTAIKGIKAGTYKVEVSKDGYVTSTKEVTVSGVDVTVNIDLEVKTLQVSSVVADNGTTKVTLPATNVTADSSLYIYFNGEVKAASIITGNIVVTKNGTKQLATVTYSTAKKAAVVKLADGKVFEPGATYTLTVNSVESADGLSMKAYTTTFTVSSNPIVKSVKYYKTPASVPTNGDPLTATTDLDGANVDGATVYDDAGNKRVEYESASKKEVIEVVFNKTMGTASAKDDANYKLYDVTDGKFLEKDIEVVDTATTPNETKVVIETSALTDKHEYTLTVEKVTAIDGTVVDTMSVKFFYKADTVSITNPKAGTKALGGTVTDVYGYLTAYAGNPAFNIQAQLDGEVDVDTINSDTIVLKEKLTGNIVATNIKYETGSRYIIVTPLSDLAEETDYEITFDGIKTVKGLKVDDETYSFTTGDFVAPTIVSTSPENAADNVAVNKNVVITFSEGMNFTNLQSALSLKDLTNKSNLDLNTYYTPSLSQDGKTLTLTSIKKLDVGTSYQIKVSTTATDDAEKAQPNKLAEDYVLEFATVGATTTYLSKVQAGATYADTNDKIENGDTKVAVNKKVISFVFDKGVATDTNTKLTVSAKKGSVWNDLTAGISSAVVSDKVYNVTKASNWNDDTTYRIIISGLKDENGNDVAEQTFVFTTGTAPSMTLTNPEAYSLTAPIKGKYVYAAIEDASSDLDISTLSSTNVKFIKQADKSAAPYTFTSAQYKNNFSYAETLAGEINNADTFTSTLTGKYKAGDVLYITNGTNKAVVKVSANQTTATVSIEQQITITGTPSVYVLDGEIAESSVTLTAAVPSTSTDCNFVTTKANYSKYSAGKMYKFIKADGTIDYAVVTSKDEGTNGASDWKVNLSNNIFSAGTATFYAIEAQGVVYTLNDDASLDASTPYQIVVSGVKDTAGNEMDAKTITFTTDADTQKLKFVSSSIEDGSVGVAVDKDLVITFNEAVKTALSDSTVVITNKTGDLSSPITGGKIAVSKDGKTIKISPNGFWKAGETYAVKLTGLASDENTVMADKTITFQAEAKASVKPKIESATYTTSTSGNVTTYSVTMKLTSPVDVTTIANGDIKVGGTVVSDTNHTNYSVSASDDKKTISLTFDVDKASVPKINETLSIASDVTSIGFDEDSIETPFGNAFTTDTVVMTASK